MTRLGDQLYGVGIPPLHLARGRPAVCTDHSSKANSLFSALDIGILTPPLQSATYRQKFDQGRVYDTYVVVQPCRKCFGNETFGRCRLSPISESYFVGILD